MLRTRLYLLIYFASNNDKGNNMDAWITISIGVVFMALGAGTLIWWHKEIERYYESLTNRMDVREFIERTPLRPEPDALKIGGLILIVVGTVIFVLGIIWL
jgi:uncharacterized membrane protein YidH (DUF202 family)